MTAENLVFIRQNNRTKINPPHAVIIRRVVFCTNLTDTGNFSVDLQIGIYLSFFMKVNVKGANSNGFILLLVPSGRSKPNVS
jgi:hypothetical protein